jgi:hypothetical protein
VVISTIISNNYGPRTLKKESTRGIVIDYYIEEDNDLSVCQPPFFNDSLRQNIYCFAGLPLLMSIEWKLLPKDSKIALRKRIVHQRPNSSLKASIEQVSNTSQKLQQPNIVQMANHKQ